MNSFQLTGYMKNMELKYLPDGKPILNFQIAEQSKVRGEKHTSYYSCTAWDKTATIISEYFKDNDKISVNGEFKEETWTNDNGEKRSKVKFTVRNFDFMSKRDSSVNSTKPMATPKQVETTAKPIQQEPIEEQEEINLDLDDKIPF